MAIKIISIIILTICLPLTASKVNGQPKNVYMLGGEIGLNYSNQEEGSINTLISSGVDISNDIDYRIGAISQSSLSLNVTPNILFYLNENLLIGAGVEWLRTSKKYDTSDSYSETDNSFLFYPEIRYYVVNGFFISSRFDIGRVLYERDRVITGYVPQQNTYTDWPKGSEGLVYGGSASAGYSIKTGGRIIADISLRYTFHKNKLNINAYGISNIDNTYNQSILHFCIALRFIKIKN